VDFPANRDYLISTQATVTGGFSKWPGNHPGKYFLDCHLLVSIPDKLMLVV